MWLHLRLGLLVLRMLLDLLPGLCWATRFKPATEYRMKNIQTYNQSHELRLSGPHSVIIIAAEKCFVETLPSKGEKRKTKTVAIRK